jgi:hypothetical protein
LINYFSLKIDSDLAGEADLRAEPAAAGQIKSLGWATLTKRVGAQRQKN